MPKLAPVPDLDEELDRLYGLSLEEFTAARDDLAKRLRAAGQADPADRVKALRKPPVSAWAVNRLAREHADEVSDLADAGEQLAKAQAKAIGGGAREAFAEARDRHAAALMKAGRLLGPVLSEAGRPATQATTERALRTLRAASLDEEARPVLVAGRLHDDVEAGGFSGLAGIELPARSRKPAKPKPDVSKLREELKQARAHARELRRAAEKARRDAGRAAEEADAAEAEADAADGAVQELEDRIARTR